MERLSTPPHRASALAALLWLVAAPQSYAVPDPPASSAGAITSEVTVTAPKAPAPAELAGESIPNFVIAHARASLASGQIARWHAPVCAVASGLPPAFNAFISARIAAVAASVGAPTGGSGCKPNIHIYFTNDPQTLINGIAKEAPALLGYHTFVQTKNVTTIRHPIEGWYATATEGDSGLISLDEPVQLNAEAEAPGTGPAMLQSKTPPGRLGTRTSLGRSSLMEHVLIMIDAGKITGLQIEPLSDYLAMLVLSQTRQQDSCGQLPSILDLMAPACDREKPTTVTAGDLAFLRALYISDLRTPYYMEKGSINSKMLKTLAPQ